MTIPELLDACREAGTPLQLITAGGGAVVVSAATPLPFLQEAERHGWGAIKAYMLSLKRRGG